MSEYPKFKHHPQKGEVSVKSAEAEKALGPEWSDSSSVWRDSRGCSKLSEKPKDKLRLSGSLVPQKKAKAEKLVPVDSDEAKE